MKGVGSDQSLHILWPGIKSHVVRFMEKKKILPLSTRAMKLFSRDESCRVSCIPPRDLPHVPEFKNRPESTEARPNKGPRSRMT